MSFFRRSKGMPAKKKESTATKANPLSDKVVERTAQAPPPKWNAVLSETIAKSFKHRQAVLASTAVAELDNEHVLSVARAGSQECAASIYQRATLAERTAVDRAFRIPMAHTNPVHDDMAQPGAYAPVGGVRGMSFDLLLERELYNPHHTCLSEVRVYSVHEWDERLGSGGAPNAHGLLDERMGPVRNVDSTGSRVQCVVCSGYKNSDQYVRDRGDTAMCVGHFGHIELPLAVWHPMLPDIVIRMLRSFCWHCGLLPGSDEKNRTVVADMYRTCETRAQKLAHLSAAYADTKLCQQCAALWRCVRCERAERQCAECAAARCFRPCLRTAVQAENQTEKLRQHIVETDNLGEDEDDVRRAVRGNNFSGFPCDVLLNGYALKEEDREPYERFAARQYGRSADNTVLVMHGERVRAVIEQMSDDYLRLFCVSMLDTCDAVRDWFRAMVPRIVPVIPNPARPTTVGHGGAMSVRTDDLTKRYKELLKRCAALSRKIEPHHPSDNPATLYGKQADIFASRHNSWFEWSDADFNYLELYGEIQYYYAAVLSDKRALSFRPSLAASHGIGNSAAARHRKAANDAGGAAGGEGRDATLVSSLERRLKGKKGRVRGNLQGKRVEQAARTVIVPDHLLSIRDVRVPYEVASRLYVPERVCGLNVVDLVTRAERARIGLVERQPHAECRGCAQCEEIAVGNETELCIFNAAGDERVHVTGPHRLKTPVAEHPFVQEVGATIERPMRTGDLVAMNRQPSLHKHSLMVMRAIVGETNAFGLHELATDPFNADFDGDEMNMYLPTIVQARAEAAELIALPRQMITTRDSAPVHGLKQDAATGMYILTSPDTFLTRGAVCNILMMSQHNHFGSLSDIARLPRPAVMCKRRGDARWHELWTGLQVANYALPQQPPYLQFKHPANFNLHPRKLQYNEAERGKLPNNAVVPTLIVNSELMFGRINKMVAGQSSRSITATILLRTNVPADRSCEEACDFIDRCSWLASAFLTMHGFSIGLGDCMPPSKQVAQAIARAADSVEHEVHKLLNENLELLVDETQGDRVTTLEHTLMAIQRKGFNAVTKIVTDSVPANNGFNVTLRAGGKGSELNVTQIMGMVGPQTIEGRRAVDKYLGLKAQGGGAGAAENNALSETTSGGRGVRKGRPSHSALAQQISTRLLDYLMLRQSPHTARGQYPGAAAGGNVKNSYLTGLTPQEFFFHAQAGREGLIDTACKTSESGDMQRLAMKSCEDVVVRADNTVRSSTNQLVSFRYGGNSYDPAFVQRKQLPFIGMSDEALQRAVFYDERDVAVAHTDATARQVLLAESAQLRDMLVELRRMSSVRNSGTEIATPNNLQAVIVDVLHELNQCRNGAQWSTPDDARITWLYTDVQVYNAAYRAWDAQLEPLCLHTMTPAECAYLVDSCCRSWRERTTPLCDFITECEVRLRLCSKQVLRRLKLSREALERVLELYQETLHRSQVSTGESVGALMVQSIGQPATQMTLNTFHTTGVAKLEVLSGVPRMKELGQATPTAKMKGVKVVLPLIDGLLIGSGQRKTAAKILSELITPQTLHMFKMANQSANTDDGGAASAASNNVSAMITMSRHKTQIEQALLAPMRRVAKQSFVEQRRSIEAALAHDSVNRRQPTVDHTERVERMLGDIDRFLIVTGSAGAQGGDDDEDESPVAPVRTLHWLTHHWRTERADKLAARAFASGWNKDAQEAFSCAHTVLLASIEPSQRRDSTAAMLCESVWRALVPIFGTDAAFAVVPRLVVLDDAAGDNVVGGKRSAGVRVRRRRTEEIQVVADLAIVALHCKESYEKKLYEHVRLHRHLIFIDLLEPSDAADAVRLARAALIDAQHSRPEIYAANIDGTAEEDREDELLRRKLVDLSAAQMRHLFKNIVSTRLFDIVDAFSLVYEPLSIDDENNVTVGFADDAHPMAPNETDRLTCSAYFFNNCFDSFGVGCQRPECVEARHDPAHEHHARARVGCLSSWVLAFRLTSRWFQRNEVSPVMVESALKRALGPFYDVMVGDMNCDDYVPLRVRVYTCSLDDALAETNKPTLTKIDQFPADCVDRSMLVLDRIKWYALNYAFCGPLHGSAVLCEEKRTQIFTAERGLEHIKRMVIVSNSADLYHLMALRGIDAKRVRTNSVHDALDVFGIEAARMTLMNEYSAVLGDGGSFVNRAHYALRADVQTRNGLYLPLTAAGLRAAPHDVCQSASHRETAMMFVRAAVNQRIVAPLVSPSANVMLGQELAHNGTGAVVLVPDMELLCSEQCIVQPEPSHVLAAIASKREEEMVEEWQALDEAMRATSPSVGDLTTATPAEYSPPDSPVDARFSPPESPELDASDIEPLASDDTDSSDRREALRFSASDQPLLAVLRSAASSDPQACVTPITSPAQTAALRARASVLVKAAASLVQAQHEEYEPTSPQYDSRPYVDADEAAYDPFKPAYDAREAVRETPEKDDDEFNISFLTGTGSFGAPVNLRMF